MTICIMRETEITYLAMVTSDKLNCTDSTDRLGRDTIVV